MQDRIIAVASETMTAALVVALGVIFLEPQLLELLIG